MTAKAGHWVTALATAAVFALPMVAAAEPSKEELAKEQATLLLTKGAEIFDPLYLGIGAVLYIVLIFLATVLSALICFGKAHVLVRTLKYYGLYLVTSIGGVVAIGGAALLLGGFGGLIALLVVGIAMIVLVIFVIPMKVYDAGALKAFLFFLLHGFVLSPLAGVAGVAVAKLAVSDEQIESLSRLAVDFQDQKIVASRDYSKSLDDQPETETTPEVTAPIPLEQEGPLLKARFAELKARFAALDRNNPEAVNQYNLDSAAHAAAVSSYNERLRQAGKAPATVPPPSAVTTPPALPQPTP